MLTGIFRRSRATARGERAVMQRAAVATIAVLAVAAPAAAAALQSSGALATGPGKTSEVPLAGSRPVRGIVALPSPSADGSRIAITAQSDQLLAHDSNHRTDVAVYDRRSRKLTGVSLARSGRTASGSSGQAQISADGRRVVFVSDAPNLVARDTNRTMDVFVRDLRTHAIRRISVGAGGRQGDGASFSPVLSRDGNHVAFLSIADDLVAGDTNRSADVFEADLRTGAVARVDVSSAGGQAGAGAVNGVNNFLVAIRTLGRLADPLGLERRPGIAISDDGDAVAFTSASADLVDGDTNGKADVFVHRAGTRATQRVSVSSAGAQGDGDSDQPAMTADGRTVVFATAATNLTATKTALGALLARDTQAGTTTVAATDTRGAPLRVAGNERTAILALSPDGRYLLFFTEPSKISANPSSKRQVILADRTTGRLELVSVSSRGVAGDHTAGLFGASISADGRRVLFTSNSSNLAPGGRSGRYALFLRTRG